MGLKFEVWSVWKAHTDGITDFALSWNNLYTASADASIKIWQLSSNPQYVRKISSGGQPIKCICLDENPSGGYLYVGLTDGIVQRWSIGAFG